MSGTVATVVSTWVTRFGASCSHVSVRWTLYPSQRVSRLMPTRASMSWGETRRVAPGGRSFTSRERMLPSTM